MFAVETTNLTKNYGRYSGVEKINLQITTGEIFGIIGPADSGKTTILKLLLNFLFPDEGGGSILGYDIIDNSREIKREVCYVPTYPKYPEFLTVKEIIKASAKSREKYDPDYADELMEFFELSDECVEDLSMNELKLVAFTAAFASRPQILLIDDLTRFVDLSMKTKLFKFIQDKNNEGMTILYTNRNTDDIEDFLKRYAVLEDGVIVETKGQVKPFRKSRLAKTINMQAKNFSKAAMEALGAKVIDDDPNNIHILYDGDIDVLLNTIDNMDVIGFETDDEELKKSLEDTIYFDKKSSSTDFNADTEADTTLDVNTDKATEATEEAKPENLDQEENTDKAKNAKRKKALDDFLAGIDNKGGKD